MNLQDIKKQISVVVQGPLDDRTYETIDCYKDFGEVIISTWDNEDLSLLDKSLNKNFKVVQSSYPSNNLFINDGYVFYIAKTTLAGVLSSTKKYVLKTRTDELYPNLDAFLHNINKYPDRLHTTDNGFWKRHPFCLSGHLFLDSSSNLRKSMQSIIDYCNYNFDLPFRVNICECILGYFTMFSRGYELDFNNWKQIFKDNVYITKCIDLPGHLHSGQSSSNRGFKRSSEPYPCGRKEMPNDCHEASGLYRHIDEII